MCVTPAFYDPGHDFYICPMGQRMEKQVKKIVFQIIVINNKHVIAEIINVMDIRLGGTCPSWKGNHRIEANHRLNHLRQEARGGLKVKKA